MTPISETNALPSDSTDRSSVVLLAAAVLTFIAGSAYGLYLTVGHPAGLALGLFALLTVTPGPFLSARLRNPATLRTPAGVVLFTLSGYISAVLCGSALVLARGDAGQLADPLVYLKLLPFALVPTILMLLLVSGLDRALVRWREARR